MEEIRKNTRVILLVVVLFIANKLYLRPLVLASDTVAWLEVLVLSVPNFFEAICGSLMLMNLGLMAKRYDARIQKSWLLLSVMTVATVYVVTQELKWHNLGGRNVYDPFDLLFSGIGLVAAALWLYANSSKRKEQA